MPANKNALIRYKTIDKCLSNRFRRWTLDDLVDACSDALYEFEGITKGVSLRTVQSDIQIMRSDKLGYNAPIEVYDHKYYRYADPDFSITDMPVSSDDLDRMADAVDVLRQLADFRQFAEMGDVVNRLMDKLAVSRHQQDPIVHFDTVGNLKGLKWLTPLYNHIRQHITLRIVYQSFSARQPGEFTIVPYLLKEFRNRWFLYCARADNMRIYNFALDRIIDIAPVPIPWMPHEGFDPATFFDDLIGVSKNLSDRPHKVLLHVSREQRNYMLTKPIHKSQTLVATYPDGSVDLEIDVILNYELYSVLLSYSDGIVVKSPDSVRRHMRSIVSSLHSLYNTEADPLAAKQTGLH